MNTYSPPHRFSTNSGPGPIVRRHWLGELGVSDATARLRRQRLIHHLHDLGPRPVDEFLREFEKAWGIPSGDTLERLEHYAELRLDIVKAAGAGQFPPLPLYELSEVA